MEGSEHIAPENTKGQLPELHKSAFDLIRFAAHLKSSDEQRDIVMFHDQVRPCERCGNKHIEIFEFFNHYN